MNAAKRSGFSGGLEVEAAQLVSHPSFLDYIRGGCEISFIVAIDMTASKYAPPLPTPCAATASWESSHPPTLCDMSTAATPWIGTRCITWTLPTPR